MTVLASAGLTIAVDDPHGSVALALFVGALVPFGLASLVFLRLLRRMVLPIDGIRAIAARYAAGNFDLSPQLGLNFEHPELSSAFQEMATELKSKMDVLVRQRNEQKAILAGMIEAVIVLNPSLEIVEANPAAAQLMQVTPGEAKGRSLIDLVRNTELHSFARKTLERGETLEAEIRLSDDPPRYLQVHGSFITRPRSESAHTPAATDRLERLILVLHDISALKTLERIRKDFVANVSHELKTPITSIKGFIETLKEGDADPATAKRFLDIIGKQTERMEAIIEDLLSLSRLEQTEGRPLAIDRFELGPILSLATDLVADSANKRGVPVEVAITDPITLTGNPSLIEQALVNLLDNAVKYSRPNGHVRVEAHASAEWVEIRVSDRGIGIAAKELPRIFERFYRVDRARSRELGGTGLGLAIVKHIALVHGGEVSVESTIGVGSIFTLRLPATGASVARVS